MINCLYGRNAAVVVTLVALALTPAAHAQGKWRTGTPIPQGANEVIGAEIDGQVFVYGGQDSSQGMAEGFDADFYHARYKLTDPYAKAVDNHGDGFEDLYGVRNFREVLKGVLFRGGANNANNKNGRRNTKYPLPKTGLDNLCEEGFKTVVYLYPTNYDKAPKDLRCRSIRGSNHMDYPQIRISKARVLLETIFAAIKDSEMGPIYMHCWNGWHASGYISALSLRQFCGVSGSDAVAYWIRNTDNNDGPEYDDHKRKIAAFVPYADLMIDTTTQRKICPQL